MFKNYILFIGYHQLIETSKLEYKKKKREMDLLSFSPKPASPATCPGLMSSRH